jgi:hypothetical protein
MVIEIYVIFFLLLDSGILLIIDLNKKKGEKGGGVNDKNTSLKLPVVFPHFNS